MGSIRASERAELGKIKEQMQDVPRLYELLEKIQQAQQSHERQLTVLRRFSKQLSNTLNKYIKELHLRDILVSKQLMIATKVCLRHMCLALLRQVQPFHRHLYRCRHRQRCHHLQFQSLMISYPRSHKLLRLPLVRNKDRNPISAQY